MFEAGYLFEWRPPIYHLVESERIIGFRHKANMLDNGMSAELEIPATTSLLERRRLSLLCRKLKGIFHLGVKPTILTRKQYFI